MSESRVALEAAYRTEGRRVLATLIRLLGGFELAEEALHEAFAAAAEQWPREGVPANPYAWLVSTGRFRIIDRWRRQARTDAALTDLSALDEGTSQISDHDSIADDELRLIFTCCHPVLAPDARVALTLREVAGLTTEEIARAYLATTPTIAQRIVRAKARIREAAIPYEVPGPEELPDRLESVLQVIYLLFNEGYVATDGPAFTRPELSNEAVRLGRLLVDLLPDPEALGLLALMLLHEARRQTRTDPAGDLVLLEHQNRTLWDHSLIVEARGLLENAFATRRIGPYVLQAAIAAVHAEAPTFAATDWQAIVSLYEVLERVDRSPVIALNRAVAQAMRDGPDAGLAAVEAAMKEGALDAYGPAHAAHADMLRRLNRRDAAAAAYRRALELTRQAAERRLLEGRLADLLR